MAGRDVLRVLWSYGVRARMVDGAPHLEPARRVTPDLLSLAGDARAEILAVVEQLPAGGRCDICGEPHPSPHDVTHEHTHCTSCALLALELYFAEGGRKGFEARQSA